MLLPACASGPSTAGPIGRTRVRDWNRPHADLIERSDRLPDLADKRLALAPTNPAAHDARASACTTISSFIGRAPPTRSAAAASAVAEGRASVLMNNIAGAEVSKAGYCGRPPREAILYASESDAKRSCRASGSVSSHRRIIRAVRPRRPPESPYRCAGHRLVERDNRELADILMEARTLRLLSRRRRLRGPRSHAGPASRRERGIPLVIVSTVSDRPRDREMVMLTRAVCSRRPARQNTTRRRLSSRCTRARSTQPCMASRESVRALLDRIERLAAESEERRAVAAEALAGAVRGLAALVHAVADDLEHEAIDAEARAVSRHVVRAGARSALAQACAAGYCCAARSFGRWHDFVGAGQINRFVWSAAEGSAAC